MANGKEEEDLYLVLDSRYQPVARAVREAVAENGQWQLRVLDDHIDAVLAHEVIQLVGKKDDGASLLGKIVRARGERVIVEPMRALGAEVRQNLRIPLRFESYIYPVTGSWKGRIAVLGNDLSCGGVSFYCGAPLENGEEVEIVLPVCEEPLIVKCRILRPCPSTGGVQLYAAKFIDLIDDEVTFICEAVFGIQITNRDDAIRCDCAAKPCRQ